MDWSPQHAMKAYLRTLHLCKLHENAEYFSKGTETRRRRKRLIEPKCTEFISALAAGKQSKLTLQVTTHGVTSLTLALAVAAKHTSGGRFVCINLAPQETSPHQYDRLLLASYDLTDAVELVHCGPSDPYDVVKQYENIDFAAIDCEVEDHLEVFRAMSVNPRGCVVVVNNVDRRRRSHEACFGEILRKKRVGVSECVTMAIGEGMELTRIGSHNKTLSSTKRGHRLKRFLVTFEN